MKKLLGVSIAAMLAVSGANATPTQTAAQIDSAKATAPAQATTQIATTSYVKGAYADIATEHNKVVADITVSGVTGDVNYITNGNSVADNLKQLNEQVVSLTGAAGGTVQDGNFVDDANTMAQNVNALDTEIGANVTDGSYVKDENKINGNLQALDSAVGAAVAGNVIADSLNQDGTLKTTVAANLGLIDTKIGGTAMGTTATSLTGAIAEINDKYVPLYGNWSSGTVTGSIQIESLSTTNPAL